MSIADKIEAVRQGRKAISHHPELRHRVHVLSQEAGREVSAELEQYVGYAKVYAVYVWVHKAVSLIANSLAPLPVRAVDKDGKSIDAHPLTELFAHVNATKSPAWLWQVWAVHKLLGGEAFLELVPDSRGKPVEVWPRRPDQIAVMPDLSQPLYPIVAGYNWGDEQFYEPDEMIHDMFYNPLSDWRGLAPITAVREGITIDIFSQAYSRLFLKRGARPDYALIAPEGLTHTEREEYKAELTDEFGGYDGWHKPIVLEKGITGLEILSWPPKDIEWLEQRKVSRDEVGGLFGVPDGLMGYGTDSYDTETKMLADLRYFWTLTMLPFIKHRDTALTSFFTKTRPMLRPGETIATDLSGVGVLQEDLAPKVETAYKLWDMAVPFNILDDRLELGIGPIPGGDVGYVSFNRYPVGSGGVIHPSVASGDNGDDSDDDEKRYKTVTAKTLVPEYGSQRHKALWKRAVAVYMPHERRMMDKLATDFEKQRKAVTETLSGEKTAKQVSPPTEASDFFDLDEWIAYFMLAYEPFYTDVTRASGAATLAGLGIDTPFNLGSRHVQEAIRTMRLKFAEDINGVTLEMLDEALRDLLAEADELGWGVDRIQEELGKRTDNVFGLRKELWQRERIARTEMHKASEMGNLEAAKQSGFDLRKAWLAALDGRERETHREAHFKYQENPIALDAQFEVGRDMMSQPGWGTDPAENINCRCTQYYVPVEA